MPICTGPVGKRNGLQSITSSARAMSLGFSAVLLIAIGLYLVAAATLR